MRTLRRVVSCAALCAVLSCTKDAAPAKLERPAPPSTGTADARVLFVAGTVDVTPHQGAPFAAAAGMDLVADDVLAPQASSKLIVQLANGHAVRLDDTGALAVRDILLFSAPPTSVPPEQQLTALLDPGESVPLDVVAERAAAWRQMRRAAESAGAERAREEAPPAREAAKSEAQVAAAPPSSPPVAQPVEEAKAKAQEPRAGGSGTDAAAPRAQEKTKRSVVSGERLADKGLKKDSVGPLEDDEADAPAPEAVAPPPPPAPALAVRHGASPAEAKPIATPAPLSAVAADLASCVAEGVRAQLAGAASAMASVDVMLEVKGGKVARVRMAGGLAVPPCARATTSSLALTDVTDGWLVVTVPLAP